MIKVDLARCISEKMDIQVREAETFLNVFMDIVGESICRGEPVRLAGFGTFDIRHVAARKARNPKTGDSVEVAATHYPTFRAGKTLKEKAASFKVAAVDVKKPKKKKGEK